MSMTDSNAAFWMPKSPPRDCCRAEVAANGGGTFGWNRRLRALLRQVLVTTDKGWISGAPAESQLIEFWILLSNHRTLMVTSLLGRAKYVKRAPTAGPTTMPAGTRTFT